MHSRLEHWRHLAAAAAALPFVATAQVAAMPEALEWRCVLGTDASHHVWCRPVASARAILQATRVPGPAESHGVPPMPGPDMRPVAERGEAEIHSTEAWRVPLHAAAADPAHVVALMQSVLCGKHPRCVVELDREPVLLTRR